MANDDRPGEWAGSSSSDTEDDTTSFHSANFGNVGETQWEASMTVDSDDASVSGTIIIHATTEDRGFVKTIYHHTDEDGFREDVETLEEGNLPSDEPQQDPPEETSEVSKKKEPKGLKKFLNRLGRFFGIGKGKNGFYVPIEEGDFGPGGPFEDSNGGPWDDNPLGPVVLWAKDGDKKVLAVGRADVSAWMEKNIKR